jgi:hypothetical protein
MSMSKAELFELLKKHIELILIPAFLEIGFELYPLSKEDLRTDMRLREPFGTLKRRGDKGIDLVEIIFCPNEKPCFTIDFGRAPNRGITLPWGQKLESEEVHTSALDCSYRLSSSSYFSRYFGFSIFTQKTEAQAEKIVMKVLDRIVEIDEWFKNENQDRHIRKHH